MNKQEAIEKLKSRVKSHWLDEEIYGDNSVKAIELNMAIDIVNQIDEPEKPVVPRFVAEWYEKNKDDLEYNLYKLCTDFREQKLREDFHGWFNDDNNKSIETLVLMHKFGYEVEKEKLYTAKLKLTNEYLGYESQLNDLLHYKVPDSSAKEVTAFHFTEDDLVKYHIWGNDTYEVREVEDE
jgi:hypothetical protein